jgi:proteasome activator subunit 4
MELDEDSDQESVPDNGSVQAKKEPFQKDLWQMRLFPYADDMAKNADDYFSYIKTGLARAVLQRDTRPGLIYYAQELSKFLNFYGRRFTKRDHIAMIELFYSVLIADDLDFSIAQVIASMLSQLLW